MNVVVVSFGKDSGLSLVQVPDDKKCAKGDKVLVSVDNKFDIDAVCQCNSFCVGGEAVAAMKQLYRVDNPIAQVVGRFVLEEWVKRE